jgi:hypothetical protein
MLEKYSYSKLSTYEQCPYQYKKIYIEKCPTKPTWQLALGLTTADILENIYKEVIPSRKYNNVITGDQILELIDNFWMPIQYKQSFSESNKKSYEFLGYSNSTKEKEERNNLFKYLSFYFKYNKLERKFGVEVSFEVLFNDILLTGRIDKLELNSGLLTVVDNKVTGSFISNIPENIQLGIYFYAISKMFPRFPVNKVGFYYIKHNKEVLIDSKNLKLDIIYSKISCIVQKIRTNQFDRCENVFCDWCTFKFECKMV